MQVGRQYRLVPDVFDGVDDLYITVNVIFKDFNWAYCNEKCPHFGESGTCSLKAFYGDKHLDGLSRYVPGGYCRTPFCLTTFPACKVCKLRLIKEYAEKKNKNLTIEPNKIADHFSLFVDGEFKACLPAEIFTGKKCICNPWAPEGLDEPIPPQIIYVEEDDPFTTKKPKRLIAARNKLILRKIKERKILWIHLPEGYHPNTGKAWRIKDLNGKSQWHIGIYQNILNYELRWF